MLSTSPVAILGPARAARPGALQTAAPPWRPATGAILLLLVVVGCSAPRSEPRRFEPPYRTDPAAPDRLQVRPDLDRLLVVSAVDRSRVQATLVGHGRLGFAPNASYAVRVPFPSFVDRALVAVGDAVSRGQPLAELRSSDVARLRAEIANGNAAVAAEGLTVERLQRLARDGTANERELIEARARLESARAQLGGARSALDAAGVGPGAGDRYTLRATTSGRVLLRTIDPGERVAPEDSQPAFLIGDPERLVVRAHFPERDAVWLREGGPCTFTVSAIGGERHEGTLLQIVRAVDPRTRAAEAVCAPKKPDPRRTAEMVARIEAPVIGEALVIVPRSAVLLRNDRFVVFVRTAPGVIERRAVEPGLSLGDHLQIVKGLSAGEQVITRGAVLLDGELDQLL